MNTVALLVMVLAIVGIVAYFGLPKLVSALGLHPDYKGPRFAAPGKSALIVTTSGRRTPTVTSGRVWFGVDGAVLRV